MKKPDKKIQDNKNKNNLPKKENRVYRLAFCGMILAFALILGYVESLIPFSFGVPGAKLGLANLAVVLCLFCIGEKEAFVISICRILISSFLFGNLYGLLYSLSGGVVSFGVMFLYYRFGKGKVLFTSALGAVSHNLAQMLVASFVVKTFVILYYLPLLVLFGMVTGILNGMIVTLIMPAFTKMKWIGD